MRAVILAEFAVPSGGAQKVALESARALAEAGVPVSYIHGIGASGDPLLDHPAIERVGLDLPDVWDLPRAKGLAAGIWNRAAARSLAEVLAGLPPGPAVIHAHQWTRSLSASVLPVCLASGRPLVVTLHDYFLACPNGVYYRFEKDEPCSVQPLSLACLTAPCDPRSGAHKAVRTARTAVTRAVLGRKPFDVIHVSDRGRATIAPILPFAVRHHRVDNPVSVERRAPAEIGPAAKIAYLGRLTREKGADLVAEAAREACVPALFVGEGPLEDEIRRRNPEAEVLGWRSPADIEALLRGRIRAVAAPSRWFETGPLTVYEALAAGVPAVASIRSGAAEKVFNEETGFVVEPTVPALAEAFRRLAADGVAQRLGQAAYDRYWRAPPTPAAHAERLVEVYRSVLDAAP